MRILITNDDGINAKGLEILKAIALGISPDVWTVAPETNQSGHVAFNDAAHAAEIAYAG